MGQAFDALEVVAWEGGEEPESPGAEVTCIRRGARAVSRHNKTVLCLCLFTELRTEQRNCT